MTKIGKALLSPFRTVGRIIEVVIAIPAILKALRNNPEYEYDEDEE